MNTNTIIIIMCVMLLLIGVVDATNVNSCSTLSVDGGNYILTQNINATGQNCITINASNITFNGMGYTIGAGNTILGHALQSTVGYTNLTIGNFTTLELNTTFADHSSNGAPIYLCTANSTIHNITTNASKGGGFYITGTSTWNIYRDNHVYSSSGLGNGFHVTSTSSNNTFYNNTVIMADGSGAGGNAFYLNSHYLNLTGNIITAQGSNGIVTGDRSANNTIIHNNSIYSYGLRALYLIHSQNDSITNNTITSVLDTPVLITYPSPNNTFSGNTISSPWGSSGGTHNIMMIGDSISMYNRSSVLGYGYYLKQLLPASWVVSSRGVSGDTTQQMLTRYPDEINLYQPTLVSIMGGANDVIQSVPQQTTINNILNMANQTKASGIHVYILIPTNSSVNNMTSLGVNLSLQAQALGYTTINMFDAIDSIPNNGAYDSFNASYYVDTVHPNAVGHALLGQKLYNQMYADYLTPRSLPIYPGSNMTTKEYTTFLFMLCVLGLLVGGLHLAKSGEGGLDGIAIQLVIILIIIALLATILP